MAKPLGSRQPLLLYMPNPKAHLVPQWRENLMVFPSPPENACGYLRLILRGTR
jgi:hypothetical protein